MYRCVCIILIGYACTEYYNRQLTLAVKPCQLVGPPAIVSPPCS